MNTSTELSVRYDPDSFDLRNSLHGVFDASRDHKRLVFLTTLLTIGLVALYMYIWPPIYRAEAMLMVERDIDASRDSFYANWDVFRKDDARSEIQLMTAGPIVREVIEKEHLSYDDVYHPFMSEISYLWQKSWIGKNYHTLKERYFPSKQIMSTAEIQVGKTVGDLQAGLSIDPIGESNVGKLKVKGPSIKVARIANTLLDTYMVRRKERYYSEAENSYKILDGEAVLASKELEEIGRRRLAYALAHGITLDLQKENVQITKLVDLQIDIASARSKIASIESSLQEVEKQLTVEPLIRTVSTVYELNTLREATKMRRLDLQTSLIQTQSRFREDSPEIRDIKDELAKLDTLIAQASEKVEKSSTEAVNDVRQGLISKRDTLKAELEGARGALGVMERTEALLAVRVNGLPLLQTTLRDFDREYMLAQEKYQQLALKRAQAAVSEATTKAAMPSMRVVDYAVPTEQSWPKGKVMYPSAILVGLLLGVVAAVTKSYFGGRIGRQYASAIGPPLYGTVVVAARRPRIAVISATDSAVSTRRTSES